MRRGCRRYRDLDAKSLQLVDQATDGALRMQALEMIGTQVRIGLPRFQHLVGGYQNGVRHSQQCTRGLFAPQQAAARTKDT